MLIIGWVSARKPWVRKDDASLNYQRAYGLDKSLNGSKRSGGEIEVGCSK